MKYKSSNQNNFVHITEYIGAFSCPANHFNCKLSHRCIPNEWLCDSEYDCLFWNREKKQILDSSDENKTLCNLSQCPPNQAKCSNNYCIDIEKFCDGFWDCDSDELNCKKSPSQCSNKNCAFDCKVTSNGEMCYCAKGYKPNGTQCDGIHRIEF